MISISSFVFAVQEVQFHITVNVLYQVKFHRAAVTVRTDNEGIVVILGVGVVLDSFNKQKNDTKLNEWAWNDV